jgi:glycosyltransferase involved in cell wall biosynthesis
VVGDLYKFKGVEQVIRALALLEEQPRPLVLVCGRHLESDYVRAITTEADRLGVGERIRLPGSLPYGELLSLLASARACIAPSRFENLSRVPWEAMSVDTPVIASDIPAFREACGDAALYFRLDRPDELAGHMRAVLAGREPRESLLASARRRLGGTPSTQASAQLLSSLEQLVS